VLEHDPENRFSEKGSCSDKELERDRASTKNHPALEKSSGLEREQMTGESIAA
jgi:hypothetical protein